MFYNVFVGLNNNTIFARIWIGLDRPLPRSSRKCQYRSDTDPEYRIGTPLIYIYIYIYISVVHRLKSLMINHKFKILGFTCKCVEINKWMTSLRKQNLSHLRQVWDIILILILSLFFCFYSAIISLYTGNKTFTKPHRFNPSIYLPNYYQKYF